MERYAVAGFASKVPESLALGTPLVANVTPELGRYIRDGQTGVVVNGTDAESLAVALRRVADLPSVERLAMRGQARAAAEANFDIRAVAPQLGPWLEGIIRSSRLP